MQKPAKLLPPAPVPPRWKGWRKPCLGLQDMVFTFLSDPTFSHHIPGGISALATEKPCVCDTRKRGAGGQLWQFPMAVPMPGAGLPLPMSVRAAEFLWKFLGWGKHTKISKLGVE